MSYESDQEQLFIDSRRRRQGQALRLTSETVKQRQRGAAGPAAGLCTFHRDINIK
jgi:hypothetical protein